ncbi:MAG: hypothetical protein M3389_03505 [Actinomycetota bacterium]|nr:hypothetical protein [Actinomycetota bacterium]
MRRLRIPALLALLALLALPAGVGAAGVNGTYKGRATNMDRDFRYGKVTMRVRAGRVTKLEIESVTTTGCGGFMTVVFAPNDSETQIVSGSARIRNGRLSVTYRPVRDVEDQVTTIKARVSGGRVTGTFKSGDLCVNEGRFTARR